METKIYRMDQQAIQEAAELVKKGELIAFPTETVYGLGADATSEEAVKKIYEAKGRPSDNPLIVHVADRHQIKNYVEEIPPLAERLIDHFMPGPFTIILKSNGKIAPTVTAGLDTVAIRIPDHPAGRNFIRETGLPIAAPSANISGKPSPTKARHVAEDLNGRIAGIIDGGATGVGLESTVVDGTGELPVILRPGGVTAEEIKAITDIAESPARQESDKPKAPGMKYNHYEPDAPMILIDGDAGFFQQQINQFSSKGEKVAVIASNELAEKLETEHIYQCGPRINLKEVAVNLYEALRFFKKTDVDIILAETFEDKGIGQAIMNRLTKAAQDRISQK
ncbi:L-threonylcarbamoyladenylate synthase [Gracilibacillus ureilyticus]|uniref:Threonylcarbamoyl-AMP synthase n=1 Tax=Gracilibacillus ureilyticus TaxID=531814 RepID=A0A1H9W2H6_9BACI|nr:L-threonylcarbamoyladenylate synthase [Gracilibacillus ureilyticus]SES28058.1 L-threonylcarbamoyladenylate synthase [Gracilibacillus ureilyticus]